jgi:hypothetical protein
LRHGEDEGEMGMRTRRRTAKIYSRQQGADGLEAELDTAI